MQRGRTVLWTQTYSPIQELLAAKRDLELPRKLRKLDNYQLVILDDIGYVNQTAEEAEVLFTLLAELLRQHRSDEHTPSGACSESLAQTSAAT